MFWWILGGLIVLPLLVLGATLGGLRNRLMELDRVAALARERAEKSQRRQQERLTGLEHTLEGLNQRTSLVQERLALMKASRDQGRR